MKKLLKKLRSHFIPHESNEFKPYFLRHQSMVVMLLLVTVVELCFLVQVFVVFDKTRFLAQVLPGVLTSLTNEQRTENSAPKLVVSDVLTRAATMKANDMAAKGYFAHTSPEGLNPWYWFKQVGYDYIYAGENLAVNFFDSKEVAQAWMNSPSHRANIVKKDYTEIGIGVATGVYEGRETVFVAQLFGTPMKSVAGNTGKVAQASPVVSSTSTPKTQPKTTPKTTTPKPVVKPAPKTIKAPAVVTKDAQPLATKVLSEESTQEAPQIVSRIDFKNFSLKSFIDKVLTSPRGAVTSLYELAALIIFLSIVLVRLIRYEHRHFPSVARGVTVIAVIFTLMLVNSTLSQKKMALKLPTNNLEASVINVGY